MLKKFIYKIKRFLKYILLYSRNSWLGRIDVTLKGLKWELHETDDDPNPSIPHLHCIEDKNLKINIYNGEMYDDGLNVGRLKDKEFNALWHDRKFLKMVNKSRKYYSEKHPEYPLIEIPFCTGDIDKNVIISRDSVNNQLIIEYKQIRKK